LPCSGIRQPYSFVSNRQTVPSLAMATHFRGLCCFLAAWAVHSLQPNTECDVASLLQHHHPVAPPACAEPAGKPAVGIFLVGLKKRSIFNYTLERLFRPLVAEGFAVHFYASLVYNAAGRSSTPDKRIRKFRQVEAPAIAILSLTAFRDHIVAQVVSVGACPVVVEVPERPLDVPELPENPTQMMHLQAKMPSSFHNVFERWMRRERLWNTSMGIQQGLKISYDLLVIAKDDSFFAADVRAPKAWAFAPDVGRTVWGVAYQGNNRTAIRDKTIVFGHEAAPAMLTVFSSWARGGFPDHPATGTESFILQAILHAGLKLVFVPRASLPESDCMLERNGAHVPPCLIDALGERGLIGPSPPAPLCR